MIAIKHYAGNITVLAAIILSSCGSAPQAAQNPGPAAADTQTAQQAGTEVPASSVLWIQLQKDLDSSKLKVGDRFKGEIAEDVLVNGTAVIPKGAGVNGRVTNSQAVKSEDRDAGLLSLVLDTVTVHGTGYSVNVNPVTLQAAAGGAYVPKKGTLQFFLNSAVRVK